MKTSFRKNIISIFAFFLTGCFVFLNTSCGLDTVYYIEGPTSCIRPIYSSNTVADYEFVFTTNEDGDYGDFNFQGTDVYYKIYSVYTDASITSDVESEVAVLESLSNDAEKSSTSFDRLRSYKYQKLSLENGNGEVLVPYKGQNREVRIRLYDSGSEYKAHFDIKEAGGQIIQRGRPLRFDNKNTFNFSGSGQYDVLPQKGDEDVSYEKDLQENKFYIAMFAVAVGNDIYWATYHSNILYLGCVPVDVSSKTGSS